MTSTVKLTIGNSYSKIEGLTVKGLNELKKKLSYDIGSSAAYFSGSAHNTKRSLLGARGDFPTGLLYLVKEFLDGYLLTSDMSPDLKVNDTRKEPQTRLNALEWVFPDEPYPEQQEAAQSAVQAKRGIISAPTGCGKTRILALMISALKVRTLVVVPNLELKRQTTEALKKALPGVVVGSFGCPIAIENVDALPALYKKYKRHYDCVIIDEFHHSAAKTYRDLNKKHWTDTFYRFGLTATPFRSASNENILLESILADVIYTIPYHKAVAKGYIVPVEAYYVEVPKSSTDGYTWSEVYKDLVVKNQVRNELISELLFRLHTAKVPALCLVKEISHGQRLQDMTGVAFAHGVNEETPQLIEWFNVGQLGTLVGTTGVLGEGVDTKPAEYVIIAGLGKSRNAFMQQVGRGMRKYPGKDSCKVIIFLDKSHKWTKAHYAAQKKILLEEYGVIPIKIDVDVSGQS